MPGASQIPVDTPNEHEDVSDLLSIARVTWGRGDHAAAVSFIQRAAQTAMELELEMRGLELAKAAADLKATLSMVPAPPVRADVGPNATMTPQLVLTPRAPDSEPETVRRDDGPVTIPKPTDTNPGLGFLTASDEVDVDDPPARDTSLDVPPAFQAQAAAASPAPNAQPHPVSPKPPTVTPAIVMNLAASPAPPRAGVSVAPRPSAAPPRTMTTSGGPPPVPVRAQTGAPPGPPPRRPTIPPADGRTPPPPKVAGSPAPPKVTTTGSIRPAAPAGSPGGAGGAPSRAPLPLRVQAPQPAAALTPAPAAVGQMAAGAIVAAAVEPQNVRKSAPWIDEVIGPITAGGGQPVVVGLKARVHFRTDGSLEIGPDVEAAGGLPVVVLPQRGEDMSILLKRLKR